MTLYAWNRVVKFELRKMITGISGDQNSRVFGSLIDGIFDGRIHISDGDAYTVHVNFNVETTCIL